MKTTEEILNNEYYKELHKGYSFDIGNYNRELIIEAMKEYAIEVAKEVLKNASENFLGSSDFAIDTRESILSETNIPKLD